MSVEPAPDPEVVLRLGAAALVTIDMQRDFALPDGSAHIAGTASVAPAYAAAHVVLAHVRDRSVVHDDLVPDLVTHSWALSRHLPTDGATSHAAVHRTRTVFGCFRQASA
jgi:nicotinamidase-related amidase